MYGDDPVLGFYANKLFDLIFDFDFTDYRLRAMVTYRQLACYSDSQPAVKQIKTVYLIFTFYMHKVMYT